MSFIYNIALHITHLILNVIALFNIKIGKGVQGRSHTFHLLKKQLSNQKPTLWFHCASLGEYEQGLPVFNKLREIYSSHQILLTFFSPSGYEIRKNAPFADCVTYLPLDTKQNAKLFVDIVNPQLAIFVKYDIWPNFLKELKKSDCKSLLISALFRKEQIYFKSYGYMMRKALSSFDHVFVQNNASKNLLNTIGYDQVTISGDTRFDRVDSQLDQVNSLEAITNFKQNNLCIVAGSTWPEDEQVLVNYINNYSNNLIKFIIAPHNIKPKQIDQLQQSILKKTILFSKKDTVTLSDYQVLIIDNIGLLSQIYSDADIAYVGGAIGTTGLHNTLEAAVFGIPIIIGNQYSKFPEAQEMIELKGMFSIKNIQDFKEIFNKLIENEVFRLKSGAQNAIYIKNNTGAVVQIMGFIRKYHI